MRKRRRRGKIWRRQVKIGAGDMKEQKFLEKMGGVSLKIY